MRVGGWVGVEGAKRGMPSQGLMSFCIMVLCPVYLIIKLYRVRQIIML